MIGTVIKAHIVRIGNSRGVRIPKFLLERLGLADEVELEARQDRLIVRPARRVRAGWDEAFQGMAAHGDDRLLDRAAPAPTRWDASEWKW